MKVVYSETGASYNVVPDAYGTRVDNNGKPFTFTPIAIAKIPVGHGRTQVQAERLANWLCQCINAGIAFDGLGEEDWAMVHGVRLTH